MRPGAYALLNQAALQHNLAQVRAYRPSAKVMAVIKANGYGHGLIAIAQALEGADAFAVARVDEGIRLREAGCKKPMTVLEGFSSNEELSALLRYQLDTVVHCPEQLPLLQQRPEQAALKVWLKMDTGMNRLGFKAQAFAEAHHQLQHCPVVIQPVGLMTHLANADVGHDDFTLRQVDLFNEATQGWVGPRSIANSAGLIGWPQTNADWVRPGVMLYGVSPFPGKTGVDLGLEPAMALQSRLIAIKPISKGETLGYGCAWRCHQDTLVGVVAIGYGDGYPRHAKEGTPVLVNGQRVPLIGRVSMDMLTVDLASQPGAKLGDPVILWGKGLPVEEIADCAATIPYTLLCGITQRVPIEAF